MELEDNVLNLAKSIPAECLVQIASHLSNVSNLLALASTCRQLSAVLNRDEVWEPRVARWIAQQDPRSGIFNATPTALRSKLGLQTMRATYQTLLSLKSWPEGLWYSTEPPWAPRGILLWVTWTGDRFQFSFVYPLTQSHPVQWPGNILKWRMRVPTFWINVSAELGQHCAEIASIHVDHLESTPPVQVLTTIDNRLMLAYSPVETISFSLEPGMWLKFHRAGPLVPAVPQHSPELGHQVHRYCPAPGLYCAMYGPHGMEVLQIDLVEPTAPAHPNDCPVSGCHRLAALKLLGDENVPCSKYSFVVNVSDSIVRPGPYNAQRDDPFPDEVSGPREILSFVGPIPLTVNLEARPVAAVFPNAVGQINRIPGEWRPEWVPATLVVYDHHDDNDRYSARFAMIFEDEGQPFRHIMEMYPLMEPER